MLTLLLITLVFPQDTLTLDGALALARLHRGQVVLASARAAAARADARSGVVIPNPTASYQYTGDSPRQHITIDQPIDWWLRRGSAGAAGRAGIDAALADSVQLIAQVEREARTGFYSALGTRLRLSLGEEEAALADSLQRIAAHRRAAGEISELEEAQATLEASRTRLLVSTSREEHIAALAELGRALGISPDSLTPLGGTLDDGVSAMPPPLVDLIALPLVQRASAEVALAQSLARTARRDRIPLPSLQAGFEWDTPTDPTARTTAIVGFSIPLPFWQSGGALSAAASARADEAVAILAETRTEAARLLMETATRVAESGRRAIIARDSIVPLAARQRELALLLYQTGETALAPVLDALRTERAVAREAIAELVAFQTARAEWQELIGGTP